MGGHRRDPLCAWIDQRHARRRGDSHRAGEVRQEAAHRRAGALGPRKPRPASGQTRQARLQGSLAADQGDLRRPYRRQPRPGVSMGRQDLAVRLGLDRVGPESRAADDRGGGEEIRRGEEPADQRLQAELSPRDLHRFKREAGCQSRRPGESWDPLFSGLLAERWIPAFAGMTALGSANERVGEGS